MNRTHQLQLCTGLTLRDWPQQHIVYVGNRGLLAIPARPNCAQPDQDVARVQVRVLHMAMQYADPRRRCTSHKRSNDVLCPLRQSWPSSCLAQVCVLKMFMHNTAFEVAVMLIAALVSEIAHSVP